MRPRRALAVALLLLAPALARGQAAAGEFVSLDSSAGIAALDSRVSVRFDGNALRDAVEMIAQIASLRLTFDPALSGLNRRVTLTVIGATARVALQRTLDGSGIDARVSPAGQVVLVAAAARPGDWAYVRGVVRDGDSLPMPGVRVDLLGTRFAAYSRDDGTFMLGRVPSGTYAMRAMHLGARPETRELVVNGEARDVAFTLERLPIPLDQVVVTPAYFGLMQATLAVPVALDKQQLETTPQLGEDVYRAMGRLPGVATDDFSAKFGVRGSSGDQLYVTLDGLQLVEPFHLRDFGNSLSMLDIRTLEGVELLTGGAPADFGDHTGGVLRMSSLSPRTDRVRTSAGISIMNARAMGEGGFAGGKGGWLLSARRGYVDVALHLLSITDSMQPRYHDFLGKLEYDAGRLGRFSLEALGGYDWLTFVDDQAELRSRYSSRYAWLRWRTAHGSRLDQETIVSVAGLVWNRNGFGTAGDALGLTVRDVRRLGKVALRQDWTAGFSERALLRFGGEVAEENTRYDYNSIVPRDSVDSDTVVFYRDTTAVRASPGAKRMSAYLAARTRPVAPVTLEAGLRFDYASHSSDRVWSPRLNATWDPFSSTTVRAAWGRHAQSQPVFALQAQNGDETFGPADVTEQREIGVDQQLVGGLALRARAYRRRMTNQHARWTNVGAASANELLPETAYDRIRLHPGVGRAKGMEVTLGRTRGERHDWGVSYTLSRVTDDINGVAIPRSLDQRHAVQLDWALHPLSNKWRLAVVAFWHSGRPYTPDSVIVDTLNMGTPFAVHIDRALLQINSARAPAYNRVDARYTRYVETRRGRVILFAEVFNLFDKKNIRGTFSSVEVNPQTRRVILRPSPRELIGRLPAVGISWEF